MPIRLINVDTLAMRVFNESSAPPYAILSHTWVEDEEVNYQELQHLVEGKVEGVSAAATRAKAGFRKIERTCEEARADGYGHAWVDACCIDKTNSAELSEAINSMFRWYARAGVCYAYLSDLEPGAPLEQSLPGCRWFTRGWCLQELVAPADVRFLDRDWNAVGSKASNSIGHLVSMITRIRRHVLSAYDVATVLKITSAATKMSWAASRTTTRTEDQAYCLLGIFDVHMPLLYGEGEKAFLRLQEEIIRRSSDLSIFDSQDRFDDRVWWSFQGAGYNQSPYRTLMAASPADFLQRAPAKPGWEDDDGYPLLILPQQDCAFSLTNMGLLIRDAVLYVTQLARGGSCYVLPLRTFGTGTEVEEVYLFLEKVGAGKFCRLNRYFLAEFGGYDLWVPGGHARMTRASRPTRLSSERLRCNDMAKHVDGKLADMIDPRAHVPARLPQSFEGDIYIINDPFPPHLARRKRQVVFRCKNGDRQQLGPADVGVIEVEPRSQFDAAGMAFFAQPSGMADMPLLGYLRLCPRWRPGAPLHAAAGRDFYLVCCNDNFSGRDAVQLYSPDDWTRVRPAFEAHLRRSERRFFLPGGEPLPWQSGTTSELTLEKVGDGLGLKVSASIGSAFPHRPDKLRDMRCEVTVDLEVTDFGK